MRSWILFTVILTLLTACDRGDPGPSVSTDPIVGIWDEPANNSGLEFRANGSVIDLADPDNSIRWARLGPGRYETRAGPRDPGIAPVGVPAELDGDLLRFEFQQVVCFRRRVWTPDRPGPLGAELEGKFIVIASRPLFERSVTSSGRYLELENGDTVLLRRCPGWVFVNLQGERLPTAGRRVNMDLGHRYRVRGTRYSLDEYARELERLGHGKVSLTRPQNCVAIFEVHELIQLEPRKERASDTDAGRPDGR